MILINTISDKYFELNGQKFAKIYQPLEQGTESVGIYNVHDTRQQLLNSTRFSEFNINGVSNFANKQAVIDALLPVIYRFQTEVVFSPFVWGQISGNIQFQTDLIALVNGRTTENEYATLAEMLANQAEQTNGRYQYVEDARSQAEINANAEPYSAYYEYLGLTNSNVNDYRLLSSEEVQSNEEAIGFNTLTVKEKSTQNLNLTSLNAISFVYDDASNKVTKAVFSAAFSKYLFEFKQLIDDKEFEIKFFNKTLKQTSIAKITALDYAINPTEPDTFFVAELEQIIDESKFDLGDKIEIQISVSKSSVGLNDLAEVATSGSFQDLDDIPNTFPPSSHGHSISQVANLQQELDDKMPLNPVVISMLTDGSQSDNAYIRIGGSDYIVISDGAAEVIMKELLIIEGGFGVRNETNAGFMKAGGGIDYNVYLTQAQVNSIVNGLISGKVNKSGDTMSGDLNIAQNYINMPDGVVLGKDYFGGEVGLFDGDEDKNIAVKNYQTGNYEYGGEPSDAAMTISGQNDNIGIGTLPSSFYRLNISGALNVTDFLKVGQEIRMNSEKRFVLDSDEDGFSFITAVTGEFSNIGNEDGAVIYSSAEGGHHFIDGDNSDYNDAKAGFWRSKNDLRTTPLQLVEDYIDAEKSRLDCTVSNNRIILTGFVNTKPNANGFLLVGYLPNPYAPDRTRHFVIIDNGGGALRVTVNDKGEIWLQLKPNSFYEIDGEITMELKRIV